MAQNVGQCRLCLAENVPLCRSHIIPRWAYKLSRSNERQDLVLYADGGVVLTTKQLAEPLLCRACEDRFMVVETRTAPLFETANRALGLQALLGDPVSNERAWQPGKVPIQDLCFFALSILWRAEVSFQGTRIHLGVDTEAIRLYLLGKISLLPHIELTASILCPTLDTPIPDMFRVFNMPTTDHVETTALHRFFLCGVLFCVWAGPRAPEIDLHGLLWGEEPLFLRLENEGVARYLGEALVNAIPKGRLSRRV